MYNKGFWLAAIALLLSACNTTTVPNFPAPGGTGGSGTTAITTVSVVATPNSLPVTVPPTAAATSTITATVRTAGQLVADGTPVDFTLSSALLGSLAPANPVPTTGGSATVTFTAGMSAGTVTVTATSGTASNIAPIAIGTTPPPVTSVGGIQFISATPAVIGLFGSGQTPTSTVTFLVTDANAVPVPLVPVSFSLNGPGGGEFLGATSGTTNSSGKVSAVLNSGNVAGPATITALTTFNAMNFTASSSVISIGGGIPSAAHFDLLVSRENLPGLVLGNVPTTFTALLADRFGNYNVLAGTAVSFYTEAGAINASGIVDATGLTSVTLRTQNLPATVAKDQSDLDNIALAVTYGITTAPGYPRLGYVTVVAAVKGEEAFADNNGNGLFDPPSTPPAAGDDTFTDLGEPFVDKNDTNIRETGELFIDDDSSGTYDGPNGVWDGPGCTDSAGPPVVTCRTSPTIWVKHTIMFTGNITRCGAKPGAINVALNGTQTIKVMVSDDNLNRPVPGTTVSATISTGGKVLGPASYTIPDGIGPFEGQFVIGEAIPGTPGGSVQMTITVTAGTGVVVTCPAVVLTGMIN
jgi:hypothetical protein